MQVGPSSNATGQWPEGGSLLDELLLAQGRQAMLGGGQALLEDVEMTWEGDDARAHESSCLLALDTNVLISHLAGIEALHDLLLASEQSDIALLIPTVVINELDRLKLSSQVQGGARRATNFLLDCNKATRERGHGALRCQRWAERQDKTITKADDRILDCCLYFAEQGRQVVLWTGDHNLAVLAEANDVPTIGGKDTSLADILRPTGIELPPAVLSRLQWLPSSRETARVLAPAKSFTKQPYDSTSAYASAPPLPSSPRISKAGTNGSHTAPSSPEKAAAQAHQPPSPKKQIAKAVRPLPSPEKKSWANQDSSVVANVDGSLPSTRAAPGAPTQDPDAMDLDMDPEDYTMYSPSISAYPPVHFAPTRSPQKSPRRKSTSSSPQTSPKKQHAPLSPQASPKKNSESHRRRSSLPFDFEDPIPPKPPMRLPSRIPAAAPPSSARGHRSGTPAQPLPPGLLTDLLHVFTPIYQHVAASLNLPPTPDGNAGRPERQRQRSLRSGNSVTENGPDSLLARLLASLLAALRQGYTAAPDRTTTRLLSRLIGALAAILDYIDPPTGSASATAPRIGTVVDSVEIIAVVLPQLGWAQDPQLLSHVLLQAKDLI